ADYDRRRDMALDDQVDSAKMIAVLVDTMFDDAIDLGQALASDPEVHSLDAALADPHLQRIARYYPQYQALSVLNANGDDVGTSVPYAPSETRGKYPLNAYIRRALATGQPVVSDAFQSVRWPGKILTFITVPVMANGNAVGTVHLVF